MAPPGRFQFDIGGVRTALRNRERKVIEGTARQAAVAIVLAPGSSGPSVLLMRRSEHPADPWSGHVSFPGGRADEADRDLVETAMRETQEEMGLTLNRETHFLGSLDETRAVAKMKAIDMKIAPHVFGLDQKPERLVTSSEVAEARWLPLSELFDSQNASHVLLEREGMSLRFPAVQCLDWQIWGLTLRMLRNFEAFVSNPARS